jgi:glutaredoxin
MRSFFIMIVLLSLQPVHADDLYRWVDKDGKVHYGDIPSDEDADRLNLNVYGSRAASGVPGADVPFEARQAMQNFPVTLYTNPNCTTPCNDARSYLNKRRIPFTETSLSSQDDIDAFRKKSGSDTVPTLSVGKNWLKGFQAQQWKDELDAVGYPK